MFSCEQSGGRLVLSGELRISESDNITACLAPFMTQAQPLEISLAQVSEVDTAGLQMLLAFCLTQKPGNPPKLLDIPAGLNRAVQLTGMDRHFQAFLA